MTYPRLVRQHLTKKEFVVKVGWRSAYFSTSLSHFSNWGNKKHHFRFCSPLMWIALVTSLWGLTNESILHAACRRRNTFFRRQSSILRELCVEFDCVKFLWFKTCSITISSNETRVYFPQRHVKNVISAFLEFLFKERPKKNLKNRLWVNVDHVSQKMVSERMYFFHFCTVISRSSHTCLRNAQLRCTLLSQNPVTRLTKSHSATDPPFKYSIVARKQAAPFSLHNRSFVPLLLFELSFPTPIIDLHLSRDNTEKEGHWLHPTT